MLKQIDELYKYLMITLLVVYLINYAYFSEITITLTVIVLAGVLEIVKQRHSIKQLTLSQLSIIGVVLLAGISGVLYLVILFRIFLNPFNLPATLENILFFAFVVISLYALVYFLKKLFGRAIENK